MAYCTNCGARIQGNEKYCPVCGMDLEAIENPFLTRENKNSMTTHPFAIAGFVLGIISCLLGFVGIVAIVFSALALYKIYQEGYRGKAFAWIGLFSGIVNVIYDVLILMLIITL